MKKRFFTTLISINIICCSSIKENENKADLESVTWVIDSLDGEKVITSKGSEITMKFDKLNNKVYGFAGCNSYSGNYTIKGKNLNISDLISTDAYCSNYNTEKKFLAFLSNTDSYLLTASALRIYSAGKVVIVFSKRK